MADDPLLLPSLLDRLLDDEPGVRREPARAPHQALGDLKRSVCRDLENLLNTRRRCSPWPSHLGELERSLVNYGLPDLTTAALGSAEAREQFRLVLEAAIRTWEPRFKTVQVSLLDDAESLDQTLRIRISGLLNVEPAPEPVAFDSALEPETGGFAVKEARG